MHLSKFNKAVGEWYLQNDMKYKDQYLKYLESQEFCDEKGNMADNESYDELCEEFTDDMKIDHINQELIYADPNFPIPSWLNLQKQERKLFVFNVLRFCFHYKRSPTIKEMTETILSFISKNYNISTDAELVIRASYLTAEAFENTQSFYNHIHISNILCIYHDDMFEFNTKIGTIGIINYNLHYKKSTMYGIISCINSENKKSWKLSAFKSAIDLKQQYGIHPNQLPKIKHVYFSKSKNNNNTALKSVSQNSHTSHNSKKSKNGKKKLVRIGNTYDLCTGFEVKNSIYMSSRLTDKYGIIGYAIKGHIPNIYEYICKLTPISVNINLMDLKIGDQVAADYDFRDKITNEQLFCVIERQRASSHKGYGLKIHNKLYKKQELPNNIPIGVSIKSKIFKSRIEIHKSKIEALLIDPEKRRELINKCQWHKLDIFNRQNNTKRMTYSMVKHEFISACNNYMNDTQNMNLVPILMFNDSNDGYSFEFILIVCIESGITVGVAFGYNEQKQRVTINGIHIDKEYIMNQHQLISSEHNEECKCLESFSSIIHFLEIGDPDNHKNRANTFQKTSNKMREFIRKDIINNPLVANMLTVDGIKLIDAATMACSNGKKKYVVLDTSEQKLNVQNAPIVNQYYYVMPPYPVLAVPPMPMPMHVFVPPNPMFPTTIYNSNASNNGKNMALPALPYFNNGYNNFNNNLYG